MNLALTNSDSFQVIQNDEMMNGRKRKNPNELLSQYKNLISILSSKLYLIRKKQ